MTVEAWTNGRKKTLHRNNGHKREHGRHNKEEDNGRHVFLKVAVLHAGQSFGMNPIFQTEGCQQDRRKFSLVSAGCDVIRIPRSMIVENDDVIIERFRCTVQWYPSDEQLYKDYKIINKWREFRKVVVNDILEKRH